MATLLQLLFGPIQLCTYFYQDVMRLLTQYKDIKGWRIADIKFLIEIYTVHKKELLES